MADASNAFSFYTDDNIVQNNSQYPAAPVISPPPQTFHGMGGFSALAPQIPRVDSGAMINFNVGGQILATSRDTLEKADSSFFKQVIAMAAQDPVHFFFVDRSARAFSSLLEMLRTNSVLGVDFSNYRALFAEVEYLGVSKHLPIVQQIATFLGTHAEIIDGNEKSHFVPWSTLFVQEDGVAFASTFANVIVPPCKILNVYSTGMTISSLDAAIRAQLASTLVGHLEVHGIITPGITKPVCCRQREMEFLSLASFEDKNWLLACKLNEYCILPIKGRMESRRIEYDSIMRTLNDQARKDIDCLETLYHWKSSGRKPISRLVVYVFRNSPVKLLINPRGGANALIEDDGRFALYESDLIPGTGATTKLVKARGFDTVFNVHNIEPSFIGAYNLGQGSLPRVMVATTEFGRPMYKDACVFMTIPETATGPNTILRLEAAVVINFFRE